jgi:hypothetical protein
MRPQTHQEHTPKLGIIIHAPARHPAQTPLWQTAKNNNQHPA